jgi:hypothetical protein
MGEYRQYDHVERLGNERIDDILLGTVYVFPKLDGTNAVIWMDQESGEIKAGSRRRELGEHPETGEDRENHGFNAWVQEHRSIFEAMILDLGKQHVLYGEWLIPHTIKGYRDDAWRNFYLFDVYDTELEKYVSYDVYAPFAEAHGVRFIEAQAIAKNPTVDTLRKQVDANTYLMRDGEGLGEGIVLKNYDWANKHGSQPWGKLVRNEFREENRREFGTNELSDGSHVEEEIVDHYVDRMFVQKELGKIRLSVMDKDEFLEFEFMTPHADTDDFFRKVESNHRSEIIPRLLQAVFCELVREECWDFVKKHKNPTIDFKKLRSFCERATKRHASEVF